jgi:hypothetical protein
LPGGAVPVYLEGEGPPPISPTAFGATKRGILDTLFGSKAHARVWMPSTLKTTIFVAVFEPSTGSGLSPVKRVNVYPSSVVGIQTDAGARRVKPFGRSQD